jgi:hypothetical protein
LNLIGRTLAPEKETIQSMTTTPKIHLFSNADMNMKYELSPVPIGLTASLAPRQQFEIYNPSCLDILYEIDMSVLIKISDSNYGQNLLRISNPSGIIPGRSYTADLSRPILSSILIDLYFYPLESKMYEIPLTVYYTASKFQEANKGRLKQQYISNKTSTSTNNNNNNNFNVKCFEIKLQVLGYDPLSLSGRPVSFLDTYHGGRLPTSQLMKMPDKYSVCFFIFFNFLIFLLL